MNISKKLDSKLTIYKSLKFPFSRKIKSSFRLEATIGVGGNIADTKRRLEHLLVFLDRSVLVEVIRTSIILKNPPFGFLEQEDFYNSLVVIRTNLSPYSLLSFLKRVERLFARKCSFVNAPRTLDLDIIFFDNKKINKKYLIIPHRDWINRDSVLVPLTYLK